MRESIENILLTKHYTFLFYFIFIYQQSITQYTVVDRGSYFIATYNRCRLHKEMETEERERKRRCRELIEEIEKKRK